MLHPRLYQGVVSEGHATLYEKYDVINNKAVLAFLLGSLVPALSETISEKLEESDRFHVVWLELIVDKI